MNTKDWIEAINFLISEGFEIIAFTDEGILIAKSDWLQEFATLG